MLSESTTKKDQESWSYHKKLIDEHQAYKKKTYQNKIRICVDVHFLIYHIT